MNEISLVLFVVSVAAAALAARAVKAEPWKGAVVFGGGGLVAYGIGFLFGAENSFLLLALQMLVTGAIGGALKLTGQQIVVVFLAGALVQIVGALMLMNSFS